MIVTRLSALRAGGDRGTLRAWLDRALEREQLDLFELL